MSTITMCVAARSTRSTEERRRSTRRSKPLSIRDADRGDFVQGSIGRRRQVGVIADQKRYVDAYGSGQEQVIRTSQWEM
jgi:hypothetical protein